MNNIIPLIVLLGNLWSLFFCRFLLRAEIFTLVIHSLHVCSQTSICVSDVVLQDEVPQFAAVISQCFSASSEGCTSQLSETKHF